YAGPQGAHAPHDKVDLDAGLAGQVQLGDDLLFEQRVHLGENARLAARLGSPDLGADVREHAIVQGKGRLQQRLQAAARAQARKLGEDLVHVFADARVGSKQAEVGIQARGTRVVVARAQMGVPAQ